MLHTVGSIMLLEAVCLVPMVLVSFIYSESAMPFLLTILILVAGGIPLHSIKQKKHHFLSREGYVTAALSWIVISLFGSLPFLFCGHFESFVDCLFESASGFSTTGATILTDIESLPKGILLWRSTTHFIGGMGILVLATAVVSSGKDRAHHLTKAEMPGPTADKLVPKLSESSKILYAIYVILTLLELVCLLFCKLSFFDAVNIALATAGTGGFTITNTSIAAYNSPAVEYVVTIFMLAFSVNFLIYFLAATRRWQQIRKNQELWFFIGVVSVSVLIIVAATASHTDSLGTAVRQALFTVAATISTTGFVVLDYDMLWPMLPKAIIIILTFFGACAGSTGGGMKCSRILIAVKSVSREIKHIIHPRAVTAVRIEEKSLDESTIYGVLHFFLAYIGIIFIGVLLISFDNFDFVTTFTASLTCMSNVGPALGLAGPAMNYSFFSHFSKIVLSCLMLIGRLEIFPILIFISPSTWKKG